MMCGGWCAYRTLSACTPCHTQSSEKGTFEAERLTPMGKKYGGAVRGVGFQPRLKNECLLTSLAEPWLALPSLLPPPRESVFLKNNYSNWVCSRWPRRQDVARERCEKWVCPEPRASHRNKCCCVRREVTVVWQTMHHSSCISSVTSRWMGTEDCTWIACWTLTPMPIKWTTAGCGVSS